MYQTLIAKIKETLDKVASVKEYFAYPEIKYTQFPTVLFYPNDFTNSFETTAENSKTYQFKMFVIIQLKGLTKQKAFEEVLPAVVDDIIAQFDSDWDMGVVDGHRIRALISTGLWDTDIIQDGEIAYAQLNLTIKTLTSN